MERPDETAVIVALWRAAYVLVDAPPHVIEDDIGLRLAGPDGDWLSQPVMGELFRPWRASIIGRARFVEDLAADGLRQGVRQLVILGAGLDSLAPRRADLMTRLRVFEVDDPSTQRWKHRRITAAGLHPPPALFFVPVNFLRAGQLRIRPAVDRGDRGRGIRPGSTGHHHLNRRDAVPDLGGDGSHHAACR